MTTTRAPAIAGFATLAAVVIAAGLWAWKPWASSPPWVPSCSDLADVMPAAAGGAWSVSLPDAARKADPSTASCELAFSSADQRFRGTVHVFISGNTEADQVRRQAIEQPCDGTPETVAVPDGYSAFRACAAVVGNFAHATVIAAKDTRLLRMTASTSIRDDNKAEVLPFSRDVVRKVAEQGLTLDRDK